MHKDSTGGSMALVLEPAWRIFANEFNKSTLQLKEESGSGPTISYPPLVPRSTVCLLLACSPKWKMFARMKTFGEHGSQIRRGASRYMRENISPKGPHFLLMPTCLNLLLSLDEHAFIRARIPHTHLFGQMKLATRRKLSATTGS